MKNVGILGFVAILSLAIIVPGGCQSGQPQSELSPQPAAKPEVPPKTVKPTGPQPKIVMIKSTHDFGKVGPGSSHKADFAFKNEGEGTLLIKRLQSTCGCSKLTLIKGEKRYDGKKAFEPPVAFEPGESGKIEATLKAPARKGEVKKSLYIHSNDLTSLRTQFSFECLVVVKVSVEPERVELKLDAENAGMPDLVVKSLDGKEFAIKSIFSVQKALKIPFDPAAKATEFTLKPQVEAEKIGQAKTGVIQIRTTHPQAGTLLVRYTVLPIYEPLNPRYILKNIEPGEPIFRENMIRSNYGKPVEIESSESRNGYMAIEKQEPDGNHMKLTIKITPPEKGTANRRYVTDELTITLKDGNKIKIRCSGWFRLK